MADQNLPEPEIESREAPEDSFNLLAKMEDALSAPPSPPQARRPYTPSIEIREPEPEPENDWYPRSPRPY